MLKQGYAVVLSAALLGGCSGSGAVPAIRAPGSPGTGVASKAASVRIEIRVPKVRHHGRRERWVSPATKSLSIAIAPTGGGTPVIKDANITGSTTVITLALNPGTYRATVSTYDAASEAGNVLSSGQNLPVTIAPGVANNVTLVLGGVPHTFVVESDGLATGTQNGGFVVYGTSEQDFGVIPEDADGYPIVGAGVPLMAGSVVSGTGWKITSTSAANPYVIGITPPSTSGSAVMKLKAADPTLCTLAGAACSTTFAITSSTQKLYVAICEASCGIPGGVPDEVAIFAAPYTGQPIAHITSGIVAPQDVAVDAAGNVFVANCPQCAGGGAAGSITEYTPKNNYAAPIATITNGLNLPNRVQVDAADDVFVKNCNSCENPLVNYVTVHAAGHYSATPVTVTSGIWTARDMLVTSKGTLLVSACNSSCGGNGHDEVEQYGPPYTGAPNFEIDQDGPLSLALDPKGNLWAGDCGPCTMFSTVAEYGPEPGAPAFFSPDEVNAATQADGVFAPIAIAVDASANLFFSNGSSGGPQTVGLYEIAPPTYTVPSSLFAQALVPSEIAADSQGTLVMDQGGGGIFISAPPYATSKDIAGDGFYGGDGSPLRFTLSR
jgi:hypothetical protein